MKNAVLVVLVLATAVSNVLADESEVAALLIKQGQAASCEHASGCIIFTQDGLRAWLDALKAKTAEMCKRGTV